MSNLQDRWGWGGNAAVASSIGVSTSIDLNCTVCVRQRISCIYMCQIQRVGWVVVKTLEPEFLRSNLESTVCHQNEYGEKVFLYYNSERTVKINDFDF